MTKEISEKAKELSDLFRQNKSTNIFGKEDEIPMILRKKINYQTMNLIDDIANLGENISQQEKTYINIIYGLAQKTKTI